MTTQAIEYRIEQLDGSTWGAVRSYPNFRSAHRDMCALVCNHEPEDADFRIVEYPTHRLMAGAVTEPRTPPTSTEEK